MEQKQWPSRATTLIVAALLPGGAVLGAGYAVVMILLYSMSGSGGVDASVLGAVVFGAIVGLFSGGFVGLLGAAAAFYTYLIPTRHRLVVTTIGAALGVACAWGLVFAIPQGQSDTSQDLALPITAIACVMATALFVGGLSFWLRKSDK